MERRLRRLKNMRLRRAKALAREVFGMRGTYRPARATYPAVYYLESYPRGVCTTPCVRIEVDGKVTELDVRCATYGKRTDRSLPSIPLPNPNIALRNTLCSCDGYGIKPEALEDNGSFVRAYLVGLCAPPDSLDEDEEGDGDVVGDHITFEMTTLDENTESDSSGEEDGALETAAQGVKERAAGAAATGTAAAGAGTGTGAGGEPGAVVPEGGVDAMPSQGDPSELLPTALMMTALLMWCVGWMRFVLCQGKERGARKLITFSCRDCPLL